MCQKRTYLPDLSDKKSVRIYLSFRRHGVVMWTISIEKHSFFFLLLSFLRGRGDPGKHHTNI